MALRLAAFEEGTAGAVLEIPAPRPHFYQDRGSGLDDPPCLGIVAALDPDSVREALEILPLQKSTVLNGWARWEDNEATNEVPYIVIGER
jgi:hypothetical protein